jgi:hypothetical protein
MGEDELQELAKVITCKEDFIAFLGHLVADGRETPDKWENANAVSYIDGMRGYLMDTKEEDSENRSINWPRLADVMLAARVYE